jgi:hypothetical protein
MDQLRQDVAILDANFDRLDESDRKMLALVVQGISNLENATAAIAMIGMLAAAVQTN